MKKYYFALFLPAVEGGYNVLFPDLPEAFTQGDTLEESMEMAEDVLSIVVEEYAKSRKELPTPTNIEKIMELGKKEMNSTSIDSSRSFITPLFLAPSIDTTPIRINVSFPKNILQNIDSKAEKHGMTRSGFLAKAAEVYN